MTQEALAAEAGTSGTMISRYELSRTSPTVEALERIAGVLDVDLVQLLHGPMSSAPGISERAGHSIPARPPRQMHMVAYVSHWDGGPINAEPASLWAVRSDLLPHDACLITRAPDGSMAALLLCNDVILVDPRPQAVASGSLVLARINGTSTPRRYLDLGDHATFETYNGRLPPVPAQRHQILGVIIAILERTLEPGTRASS